MTTVYVWMYGCMDVWMYGCMDVWMDHVCMDVWMDVWNFEQAQFRIELLAPSDGKWFSLFRFGALPDHAVWLS